MNKKLTVILTAMLMLTACSGEDNSDSADILEITLEASVQSEAESEAKTEAVSESNENLSNETRYDGSFYNISVNTDKWTDAAAYIDEAAEYAEDVDNGLDYSAEQYSEMCDAMFYYNDSYDSDFITSFNIVTQELESDVDMDSTLFGDAMAESFNEIEGYSCDKWESADINGNDCLKLYVSAEQDEIKIKMLQCMFLKGGKQTVVTLTAKESEFESAVPDFNEVVNTIKLK